MVARKKWWNKLRWLTIVYAAFFFISTSPLPLSWYRSLENYYPVITAPIHHRAAVVLSGDAIQQDLLSKQYFYNGAFCRLVEGLRLLQNKKVDYLLVTRGNNFRIADGLLDEGRSFLALLKDLAIPSDQVILLDKDSDVLNTYDELSKLKPLLAKLQATDNFYLVSSAFHLRRAVAVAKKLGLNPTPYPAISIISTINSTINSTNNNINNSANNNTNNVNTNVEFELQNINRLYHVLNELVGLLAYRLKGYG
ncbi:MAG: YdcF family protein [Oligoflexia bacterium]|nr:YdcF family protein [Oligoflexia bacterium]